MRIFDSLKTGTTSSSRVRKPVSTTRSCTRYRRIPTSPGTSLRNDPGIICARTSRFATCAPLISWGHSFPVAEHPSIFAMTKTSSASFLRWPAIANPSPAFVMESKSSPPPIASAASELPRFPSAPWMRSKAARRTPAESCVVDGTLVTGRGYYENAEVTREFLRLLREVRRP